MLFATRNGRTMADNAPEAMLSLVLPLERRPALGGTGSTGTNRLFHIHGSPGFLGTAQGSGVPVLRYSPRSQ